MVQSYTIWTVSHHNFDWLRFFVDIVVVVVVSWARPAFSRVFYGACHCWSNTHTHTHIQRVGACSRLSEDLIHCVCVCFDVVKEERLWAKLKELNGNARNNENLLQPTTPDKTFPSCRVLFSLFLFCSVLVSFCASLMAFIEDYFETNRSQMHLCLDGDFLVYLLGLQNNQTLQIFNLVFGFKLVARFICAVWNDRKKRRSTGEMNGSWPKIKIICGIRRKRFKAFENISAEKAIVPMDTMMGIISLYAFAYNIHVNWPFEFIMAPVTSLFPNFSFHVSSSSWAPPISIFFS